MAGDVRNVSFFSFRMLFCPTGLSEVFFTCTARYFAGGSFWRFFSSDFRHRFTRVVISEICRVHVLRFRFLTHRPNMPSPWAEGRGVHTEATMGVCSVSWSLPERGIANRCVRSTQNGSIRDGGGNGG